MNRLQAQVGKWIRVRMGILSGALALGLGLMVAAAFNLTAVDGEVWRETAEKQRQRRLQFRPKRGTILDRNGSALAISVDVPSVSMDSVDLLRGVRQQNIPVVARDAANRISAALGLDPARIESKILAKRRFTWLKRRISEQEVEAVRQLMKGTESQRRIRGLRVDGEAHRYYPRREVAGTLLGFVSPDGEGRDGFELSQNEELRGHVERLRGLRDRSGRLLFADGIADDQALAGHNLYLSIEQGLQYTAERELALAAQTFEAKGGSLVVIEPNTGEILALASYPSYNPNDYRVSDPDARRDRALSDRFEPGSTMKIFTVAAGLAANVITPTQQLYCEKGRMPVDNVVIRDTHPAEWLTVSQVLAVSSNICSAKIGLSMGGDRLYESLRRFGFGQPTGVPLPGESSGILRPRGRPWVQVETAAASFGQGISVTNLQLALAVAAVANGGELMEPILVKKVTTATGEVVREAVPRVRRRAVPRRVARIVTEMMVAVTEGEGTGTGAAIEGFQVAGKTATAQKSDPKTGRYSLEAYIASFVGFVPARKPRVAIAVTLDEPMVEHAGGAVAAPTFRRVATHALKYFGVTPRGTKTVDLKALGTTPDPAHAAYAAIHQAQGRGPRIQEGVPAGSVPRGKVRIPDLSGLSMRQALKKSTELGFQVEVKGSGILWKQEPSPGEVVEPGGVLMLEFEPAS